MKFGLYPEDVARYIREEVDRLVKSSMAKEIEPFDAYDCWIGKTTSEITPRDGDTFGSGTFKPYLITDDDGSTQVITDSEGSDVEITLYNGDLEEIPSGRWIQCKTVGGRPVVNPGGGGGGNEVLFEIVDAGYPEDYPSDGSCEDLPTGPTGDVKAEVIRHSCGGSVQGKDENGLITLVDELGFFDNRSVDDLEGKKGLASYMSDGYSCEWVVTWIDWFRKRQTVVDWRKTADQIIAELEEHWVWNHCELPDYVIDLAECPDDEYGGCS